MTPAAYHRVQFSAIGLCLPQAVPWLNIRTIIIDIPATLAANTLLAIPIVVCIVSQIIADLRQLSLGRFIREFHLSCNWFCPRRVGCILKPRLCLWVLKVTDTKEKKETESDAAAPGRSAYMSMVISGCGLSSPPHTHICTLIHTPLSSVKAFYSPSSPVTFSIAISWHVACGSVCAG